MPPVPSRSVPLSPRRVDELIAGGWSESAIDRAVARGELRRMLPTVYVDSGSPLGLRGALEAARAHLGPDTAAVLASAAELHGLPTPWPADGLAHVALPPGRERIQRPGFRFHTWLLGPTEVVELDGFRATSLERTLQDLMCLTDRMSAVSALDAALHAGRMDRGDVERLRATTVRRRGAARSREWWHEADRRAESPLETRVRLRAVDGGYPPDDLQRRFELNPGVAYVDLAWLLPDGRWLGLEADGYEWHDTPEAIYRDRRRANALTALGVVPARAVWADTTRRQTIPALLASYLGPPRAS